MDSTLQTSSISSSISEQKYINLRKRLDQLGYRQTLGIESLPLIEKLFNDLVHTTESLKKAKLERSKNAADSMNSSLRNSSMTSVSNADLITPSIQAYKADNAKLIKENNELHLQLIKIKDQFEVEIKELKIKLGKSENENSDLRFLNTQYLHKLRSIEKESKDKSKKILDLQEKNFQAVIQTNSSSVSKQGSCFRRQRLDIDCMLPPSAKTCSSSSLASNGSSGSSGIGTSCASDPYVIDMIKLADERISQIQTELDTHKQSNEILNNKVSTYKTQIENREREIERLNRLLDGGRSFEAVSMEANLKNNERLLAHQNMQIEFLQEKNHELECQLQDMLKGDTKRSDRELNQCQYEIKKSREDLNKLDNAVHLLENEKRMMSNEMFALKSEINDRNQEIINLHELIEKIQEDKCKLTKKISKLVENERDLVKELDSLKLTTRRSNSNLQKSNSTKTLNPKLDSHIKNIESERDFYKQEVSTLQKLLKQNDSQANRSRSNSPSKRGLQINGTNCTVCSLSPTRQQSSEVKQLKRERDELQQLLDKFERHMSEIQSNIKVLTNERDRYNQMYEETKAELARARKDILSLNNEKGVQQNNMSLAAQSMLKRAESERDSALFDLRNAIAERDALKERHAIANDNFSKDKVYFEHQVNELQERIRKSDLDKKDLCKQIDLLQNQLEQLENKIQTQNYHMAQAEQDLHEQKSASSQIRYLAEESERALEEQRRQLAIKTDELNQYEQIKFRLEQKIVDLQELNRTLKDEINSLRMSIGSLDKDKDKLLASIDEKTVENVTFKQELASKHKRIDELNSQLAQLDAALDRTNDELKSNKKEINALRIQVDRGNEETSDLSRRYDSACRENKRLQDDLITVTRENQVLHCELEKSNGDKECLREQLQEYINEVAKFEDLLKQKEMDRSGLLDQYREISNEMNGMKASLSSFENETNNLKMEIQIKHADNKRLRERLDILERDHQQQLSACQEYEVKLSSANRNLQRCEEQLKKAQSEIKDLMQDVMHSRDLNSHLEQAKEDLSRKLTTKELDYEQLQNQLADKRAENDLLKSQVNSERTMVRNLEELIANNREKDFQIQLSTQERDSELKLLKDRISLSEQKIQGQNKEINALRSRIVEYETDNERLKRQLTNERFERERAAQELRKISDSADLSTSSRFSSPIRVPLPPPPPPPPQPCITSSLEFGLPMPLPLPTPQQSANTAMAAAAAAVAASNAASAYRSLSPIRSRSPYKELSSGHFHTSSSLSASNLRYSSVERRNLSPSKMN